MKKYSLLFAIVLAVACSAAVNRDQSGYAAGDKARDFSLKNVDGSMVSLQTQQDVKGYILTFTCNHCPYAVLYEDRLIDLHNTCAPKGFPVIAINPNDPKIVPEDSFANMKKRAKKKKFPFPYLMDETQEIAKAYGATKTPHIYLLEKTGDGFYVRYVGAIDNNASDPNKVTERYVENAIAELLAGKPVSVTETKAVGCTVKWRE